MALSPSIHKFGDEFTHSGLSVVRHSHHPEFFEGLSEYAKAFHWIAYVTVFANRSTKPFASCLTDKLRQMIGVSGYIILKKKAHVHDYQLI